MKTRIYNFRLGVCAALISPLVMTCAGHRVASNTTLETRNPGAASVEGESKRFPKALAKKLARLQKFAPSNLTDNPDSPESFAEQDWLQHSIDGAANARPPIMAFARAHDHWSGMRERPSHGNSGGRWIPLGPTNAQNDLTNTFRDRTVYTAGTENFGGRTVHGVIDPDCQPSRARAERDDDDGRERKGSCTLWIAATNGGVWRTDNALAVDDPATPEYEGPAWDFISETFGNQSVASLELDPNDPEHRTIWAGTGEPNACGSGCEVGVGVYVSKDRGNNWRGPLGAAEFSGRGVGSIVVKPGDSKTVFVATGRATRGISNTCCGGTDAFIPGAAHFGVWRSKDEGKSWELVNQGANALCTASTPDVVSLNNTACSPRGARRIKIDPVDPNTVYASFFARGIWRSRSNGDPGTWERIMEPRGFVGTPGGPTAPTTERDEFDVVLLPNGETRMYVGAGGGNYAGTGANAARLRRNEAVRNAPPATVRSTWTDFTTFSFAYCEPQCSYDNYVYAPANPRNAPNSGANHEVVYLSGSNQYGENNTGSGRSNGRAVLLSTDGGATFTDMTEDNRSSVYPGALHPDHHAIVVNPLDWKQFFDLSDGGVNRSNGVFVNDSGDCLTPPHNFIVPTRVAFCQVVLSRVPQTLTAINRGLRTLATYTLDYDRTNPGRIAAGTQDNGSWETINDKKNWLQVNIADGGPNRFDATGADALFALTAFQAGQLMVRYNPLQQYDANWIADTLADPTSVPPYALEASAFIVPAVSDPVHAGWLFTGREHVFRSTNYGRNPILATKELHRANCNIWNGHFADLNNDGTYTLPADACDDWKALGDPGPNGRLTSAAHGDRPGVFVSVTQRAPSDPGTLWAATGAGRIFVSKNADNPLPTAVVFDRIDNDPTATNSPPRYPTSIFVDRRNPNHAWITYSGYNAKTPATPGHVFEVFYAPNASVFINRDGSGPQAYGDIPANAIVVTSRGTYYVANDYGVVVKERDSGSWRMSQGGLPKLDVADLILVTEKDSLYAATHGQGVWQLKLEDDD